MTPGENEFEAKVRSLQADPAWQENQRRHEREAARERQSAERERLRRAAWRTVQGLKDARLAAIIEPAIREVGGGVEALASWEAALRAGRGLTRAEHDAVRAALASTKLDWALRNVDKLLREAEQQSKGSKR